LCAVKDRKLLREEEYDDEDDRIKAIEEVTNLISRGISKVCAIWGLDESDIEDMDYTVDGVLADNDSVVELLGTSETIYSPDADDFATEVKPYLDSTPTRDDITAWPLIDEVRIYVKSDILKHGIVLVDLPGLSDMVRTLPALTSLVS
jgi:hypothetical protein